MFRLNTAREIERALFQAPASPNPREIELFVKSVTRYLVVLFISLFAWMVFSPAANAALAPAEVQYQYDPIPQASDDRDADASGGVTSEKGTPSQFSPLLIGGIVLILLVFGTLAILGRRRRKETDGLFPRPTIPLALLGAILIGAMAFGASGTTAAPSPKAPPGFLNIAPQEGVSNEDTARMAAGGISVIRVPVSWATVQAEGPDSFNWGLYDAAFRAGATNGLSILPVLYGTPAWMASKTTTLPKSKQDIGYWRKFVAAGVQRYGSKGTFWDEPEQQYLDRVPPKNWQLWNEVNFRYFASPVSAKAYGKMVNAASPIVRANDPKTDVMLSGLFGRPKGPPKKAVHADKFLRQVSKYVKPKRIDSIALHPYAPNTKQLKIIIKDFRKAANKSGYRKKPIHVTEIGWGSGKATNAFLKGSEAKQAKQLTSALKFLIKSRKKYRIKSAYWYSWKDTDPKGQNCSFCYSIGLFKYVRPEPGVATPLKPKPAWKSFVKLTGGRVG